MGPWALGPKGPDSGPWAHGPMVMMTYHDDRVQGVMMTYHDDKVQGVMMTYHDDIFNRGSRGPIAASVWIAGLGHPSATHAGSSQSTRWWGLGLGLGPLGPWIVFLIVS